MKKNVHLGGLSHMCITMHGSENVKSVFSYVVCLMVMCVVKQVAYSTELQ